ncbi:hypothetical protein D3C76_1792200 [compost metagenome]
MRDQLIDGIEIGNRNAVEAPFLAQNPAEKLGIAACRYTINRIKCGHHHGYTSIYGSLIGW